jgi:hypothetical protein
VSEAEQKKKEEEAAAATVTAANTSNGLSWVDATQETNADDD